MRAEPVQPGLDTKSKGLRQVLQETVNAPTAASRPWSLPGVFPIAGRRRRAFSQLKAIAVPALLVFTAAIAGLLAHDARPADIVTAVILTTVYVSSLELIGRSTWLSPLALGLPITAALCIIFALPIISLLNFWIPGFDVTVAAVRDACHPSRSAGKPRILGRQCHQDHNACGRRTDR